jgi:AAA+ superfamily predicted ATPase
MFITTNVFESIDPAVESRVHVHIIYPKHNRDSRASIWKKFMARIPAEQCKLTESEVEELGKWDLNGRQIKNALMMTLSWCRQNEKDVDFATVEDIIGITCPRAIKEGQAKDMANGNFEGSNEANDLLCL